MSTKDPVSSSSSLPSFNWQILLTRATTIGVTGFVSTFTWSYGQDQNLQKALTTSLYAFVASIILGTGYDQLKFQDSVRNAKNI